MRIRAKRYMLILRKTRKMRQSNRIKQGATIVLHLMVSFCVFFYFACAPIIELQVFPFNKVGMKTDIFTQVGTNTFAETSTAIKLIDNFNNIEYDITINIGEILNNSYIKYSLSYTNTEDTGDTNYILFKDDRYYKFNGYWSAMSKANTIDAHDGEQYIDKNGKCIKAITSDITTLYAHWAITCKVNFHLPNGTGYESNPVFTKYPYVGKTLIDSDEWITECNKKPYNLSQILWYEDTSNTILANSSFVAPDVKLKRLYGKTVTEFVSYTVTLILDDDAEIVQDPESPQPKAWTYNGKIITQVFKYEKGGTPEIMGLLPTPQRLGYKYHYWVDENKTTITDKTQITKDYTCTPYWEAKEYTIKISSDGEELQTISMTYDSKTIDTVKIPASKEHYTFDGYYDEKGEQYFDSTGNNVKEWNIASDTTLTARYTPIEYSITYELDNGILTVENPTQYNIEDETIILNEPTKEGYTFVGWKTSASAELQTEVTIPTGSYGNKNYIAVFQQNTLEENVLSITIKCTNFDAHYILIYIFDENDNLISTPNMQTPTLTFIPPTIINKYRIVIRATYLDNFIFTLPSNCTQENAITICLIAEENKNYTISFTASNIQNVINKICV